MYIIYIAICNAAHILPVHLNNFCYIIMLTCEFQAYFYTDNYIYTIFTSTFIIAIYFLQQLPFIQCWVNKNDMREMSIFMIII